MLKYAALIIVTASALLVGLNGAQAENCQQVDPTSLDPVEVCTGQGDEANGTVAVSTNGNARGSGDLPLATVSGTGDADRSVVAVSGSGAAGERQPADDTPCPSPDENRALVSVAVTGVAFSCFVSASGTGDARSSLAGVSGTGDSGGSVASVSGTGKAGGHHHKDNTPQYNGSQVAVSGCAADNGSADPNQQPQQLTADPTRVWVNTNTNLLTGQPGPTDLKTPLRGVCV